MSKDDQQQRFACPPMEMDATSGERKRYVHMNGVRVLPRSDHGHGNFTHMSAPTPHHSTPVVSRYPRSSKVYTDSLEGLSPGGATLLAAVPRTNPDGTRVYTPVRRCVLDVMMYVHAPASSDPSHAFPHDVNPRRRSTRLLSAAINSSGKKGQSHGKAQATPSPLRRDMERLLSDMRPLNLHDE